jgi:RNA polymerase sigma factor (sigma-70 family)
MALQLQAISAATEPGALVAAAADGNADAWRALVDRFAPLVHGVARSFRLPRHEAEDVSQTVWLRLVEHLGRLREPDRVGAWLASTARHECLRTLRLTKRGAPLDDAAFPEPRDAEQVDARLLRAERDARVREAYDGLAERCRVLLRVVTDDPVPSYAQVATAVGISTESVGPIRSRCLAGLRRSLEGDAYETAS